MYRQLIHVSPPDLWIVIHRCHLLIGDKYLCSSPHIFVEKNLYKLYLVRIKIVVTEKFVAFFAENPPK